MVASFDDNGTLETLAVLAVGSGVGSGFSDWTDGRTAGSGFGGETDGWTDGGTDGRARRSVKLTSVGLNAFEDVGSHSKVKSEVGTLVGTRTGPRGVRIYAGTGPQLLGNFVGHLNVKYTN